MGGPTRQKLEELYKSHQDWLEKQPGVARTGLILSPWTGDPALHIGTKAMPPRTREEILNQLRRGGIESKEIEFKEIGPGDEVIPY